MMTRHIAEQELPRYEGSRSLSVGRGPDTFFFMRAFPDIQSREPLKAQFYDSELWKGQLEDILLPMLENPRALKAKPPRVAIRSSRCRLL
jgi:hypothetical protein